MEFNGTIYLFEILILIEGIVNDDLDGCDCA